MRHENAKIVTFAMPVKCGLWNRYTMLCKEIQNSRRRVALPPVAYESNTIYLAVVAVATIVVGVTI
jgi:hypothetical protein